MRLKLKISGPGERVVNQKRKRIPEVGSKRKLLKTHAGDIFLNHEN